MEVVGMSERVLDDMTLEISALGCAKGDEEGIAGLNSMAEDVSSSTEAEEIGSESWELEVSTADTTVEGIESGPPELEAITIKTTVDDEGDGAGIAELVSKTNDVDGSTVETETKSEDDGDDAETAVKLLAISDENVMVLGTTLEDGVLEKSEAIATLLDAKLEARVLVIDGEKSEELKLTERVLVA
jgi:hypothetical protein